MKQSIKDAYANFLNDPLCEDKLIAALEKERMKWLQHRQQEHDEKWRQNVAFYAGNHRIRNPNRSSSQYQVFVKENHTNNVINRMVSIFVQNMPITRVFPANDESQAIQDAEGCESFLRYDWRLKKMEQKYAKLVKYAAIFGNGFAFRGYDPFAGGVMNVSAAENEGVEETRKWRGDVRIDIDDPFKILVRPGIEEMEDHFDFFRSVASNKADIEAQYGEIETDPVTIMNAYSGQTRHDDDVTMVHHYYHKPTNFWEKGVYICYCGKKILKATSFPYDVPKLPLEHLPFDKPPMKFWAMATIDQIIDLQEQLNKASSMIVEARNLIARPRVLAHRDAKVPPQSITDRPGEVVNWQGTIPPQFQVPSFNFGEMANHKGDVRNALQMVSGMSGASRGEIPQATKTALALQLVLEQDRSQWTPFIKQFYSVIQATELGKLEIAAQYFPEEDPRAIKIEGQTGTKMFHGGMVPSPLDVWLEDTNPLGWTAGGRIERIESLYQSGVIKDENKILEMLHLNNDSPAYASEKASRLTAKRENDALNRGELVDVESEDIDPIHLDEHTREMQSYSYKSKPQVVKMAFEQHVMQHKKRMAPPAPMPGMPGMPPPPPGAMPPPPPGGIRPNAEGGKAIAALAAQGGPAPGNAIMDKLLTSSRG